MEWSTLLIYLFLGMIVGVLAGFFGIGGGLVAIPVLLWIFESQHLGGEHAVQLAFGTNLFVIILTACLASYRHSRNGYVLWQAVPFLAAFSIVGALLGAKIASSISGVTLKYLFTALLLYSGIRLLFVSDSQTSRAMNTASSNARNRWYYVLTGLLIGLVSGITGLGGGVVALPLMIFLLRFPVKAVAGTSSSVMIFTSMAATLGYIINGWHDPQLPPASLGYVYLYAALPLMIGSAFFVQLGAQLNHKIGAEKLRVAFALFLLLMGVKMLFF